MFEIIISAVKIIGAIVLPITSCFFVWFFFSGNGSENETIHDGVATCIFAFIVDSSNCELNF